MVVPLPLPPQRQDPRFLLRRHPSRAKRRPQRRHRPLPFRQPYVQREDVPHDRRGNLFRLQRLVLQRARRLFLLRTRLRLPLLRLGATWWSSKEGEFAKRTIWVARHSSSCVYVASHIEGTLAGVARLFPSFTIIYVTSLCTLPKFRWTEFRPLWALPIRGLRRLNGAAILSTELQQ